MNWKNKVLILLVGLMIFGGAFFSENFSNAQQTQRFAQTDRNADSRCD